MLNIKAYLSAYPSLYLKYVYSMMLPPLSYTAFQTIPHSKHHELLL